MKGGHGQTLLLFLVIAILIIPHFSILGYLEMQLLTMSSLQILLKSTSTVCGGVYRT